MSEFVTPNYTHDTAKVEAIVKEGDALFIALMGAIKAIDKWERETLNPFVVGTGLEDFAWGEPQPEGTELILRMYREGPSADDDLKGILSTLEEMYPDHAD